MEKKILMSFFLSLISGIKYNLYIIKYFFVIILSLFFNCSILLENIFYFLISSILNNR